MRLQNCYIKLLEFFRIIITLFERPNFSTDKSIHVILYNNFAIALTNSKNNLLHILSIFINFIIKEYKMNYSLIIVLLMEI